MATALLFVTLFHNLVAPGGPVDVPQAEGFEDTVVSTLGLTSPATSPHGLSRIEEQSATPQSTTTTLNPVSRMPRSNYSRLIVIPRMGEDDVTWISTELPGLDVSVYVADDPGASLHPPKNKGHEVMIYLSYLIDNYHHLPDIVLFMHAHRWTHHNNLLLGSDASQMINALNGAHVMREGYVNMRCHWSPGCPEWLRPTSQQDTLGKQEEAVLERCWKELFPFDTLPSFLAQPCCAQFALSRDRIHSIPRSRFVYYRDWILKTPLSDYISGRIWEYSWQYIFTQHNAHCPSEHVCYCDGFGVCFGGESNYKQYVELLSRKNKLSEELERSDGSHHGDEASVLETSDLNSSHTKGSTHKVSFLAAQVANLETELIARRHEAQRRGADPRLRAEECGRLWAEGDGF